MPDEDKTFSGSFVLDLRIWWRQVHTLYLLFPISFLCSHDTLGGLIVSQVSKRSI